MKKLAFLLLTVLTLLSYPAVYRLYAAEPGFFIPQKELQPRYEKLPPINQPVVQPSAQDRLNKDNTPPPAAPVKKVSRYIAVDGRYIPIFEKETKSAEITPTEETNLPDDLAEDTSAKITTDFDDEETTPAAESLPEKVIVSSSNEDLPAPSEIKPVEINSVSLPETRSTVIAAPQADKINPDLPNYRNRYTQYLHSLQIFGQTGLLPASQELDDTLGKMNSNRFIKIFDGIVE